MTKCVLGDVAKRIQTGPFGSQLHQSDYSLSGTPVVMPKDIADGAIVDATIARVGPQHVERLARHKLNEGDLLFSRRGDVGRCALVRKEQEGWLCGTGCLRVELDVEKADYKYLYYFLRRDDVAKWLESHAVGAIMLNINPSIVSQLPVVLPPLDVQRNIAKVLSAIDRKIALNRKRIATLEAMAKEIYDYWFVQFDFPDAHGRPYKSSGGAMVYNPDLKREIPKGWEAVSLGELISVCNGKDHKVLSVGDIPVYGSGGIMRRVDQMLYEGESVLIPRKGTLNNIMYVNGPLWCIDTMFYTKPKVYNVMKFIFMTIKDWDFASMDTGSAVPSMTAGIINKLSVARPADVLLEKFENQMRALFVGMSLSEREIAKLTSLRSFLLPLLMNGQAKVR